MGVDGIANMNELIEHCIKNRKNPNGYEALRILQNYGIPVAPFALVHSVEEAVIESRSLRFPLVMKIVADEVSHKSDFGGVILNIEDEKGIRNAFEQISNNFMNEFPDAKHKGLLLMNQVKKGLECILGVTRDEQFGHCIMFGLGGTLVELFKDVSFRILPLSEDEMIRMIRETKAFQLMNGYRNMPRIDTEPIIKSINCINMLITDYPEIAEIDMNPIILYEDSLVLVDGRMSIRPEF
ncbi:MAG TPA: acetyl-CoA synthetase [Clostridiaceae bacterium]|nr:acetyl-CoA synthetase [Clostridiaceae bacterium]